MTSIQDDTAADTASAPIKQPKTGTQLLEEMRRAHLAERYAGRGFVNAAGPQPVVVKTKQEQTPKDTQGLQLDSGTAEPTNGDMAAKQWGHKDIKTNFPPPPPPKSETEAVAEAPVLKLKSKTIVEEGAQVLQVKLERLTGKERSRDISYPRRVIVYFMMRYIDKFSLPQAAKAIGFKDHTSAMYARNKMAEVLEKGPADEYEMKLLVWLKKLCKHFGKELPPSPYWAYADAD